MQHFNMNIWYTSFVLIKKSECSIENICDYWHLCSKSFQDTEFVRMCYESCARCKPVAMSGGRPPQNRSMRDRLEDS